MIITRDANWAANPFLLYYQDEFSCVLDNTESLDSFWDPDQVEWSHVILIIGTQNQTLYTSWVVQCYELVTIAPQYTERHVDETSRRTVSELYTTPTNLQ